MSATETRGVSRHEHLLITYKVLKQQQEACVQQAQALALARELLLELDTMPTQATMFDVLAAKYPNLPVREALELLVGLGMVRVPAGFSEGFVELTA